MEFWIRWAHVLTDVVVLVARHQEDALTVSPNQEKHAPCSVWSGCISLRIAGFGNARHWKVGLKNALAPGLDYGLTLWPIEPLALLGRSGNDQTGSSSAF